jgi:hypothetical protein
VKKGDDYTFDEKFFKEGKSWLHNDARKYYYN